MLCSSFLGHWNLNLFKYRPVQDNPSAHQDSSELTRSFRSVFCAIFRWVAWPALFIFIIIAHMHLTQNHWVDSTLALPWERRSASEQQLHGVGLCVYTYITPITQILYLVSIGQRHVPLHFMVWWSWLLPVFCFAARFCNCMSLVVSVEGHHQTYLPLQESLTARCVVVTKSKPAFEGMLLHFHIFYCSALAMTHLSCPIILLLSVNLP